MTGLLFLKYARLANQENVYLKENGAMQIPPEEIEDEQENQEHEVFDYSIS